MLMGRLKSLNMLIKLDGAIFWKPVLNLLREFAECRIWVRVRIRDQYNRFIAEHMDRHRGTGADAYTPEQFKHMMRETSMKSILSNFALANRAYTQGLHRDLCIRTMTVLGHHTLARACTIRNLQLPDMMMWNLGARSETDPVKDAFMFVRACRTGKTNKDFSLNYIAAVWHLDWTLCAVGATLMWLHWVYDVVPVAYEDIAPPLDFSEPAKWYDKYIFFPLYAGNEKPILPTTHHDWAAKILGDARITCSRVVHATRAGGAQHASADGGQQNAQNQVTVLTEYLTHAQADNTRLGVQLVTTQKRVSELEKQLEERDQQLIVKVERVNDMGGTAVASQRQRPGADRDSKCWDQPFALDPRRKVI
ncbi:unnamed protein product [Closterium sp. Yama58-4]|nr:unnamed protein product [Closterium sp. Yama58-4]